MFEATLNDPQIMKKIGESLKILLEQVSFKCDKNGIRLEGKDESIVAFISLFLPMSHPHSDVVKMTFQNEKTGKSRKVCTKLREYEETDLTPQGEFSSIVILDSKVFQRELSHFNQCKKVRIRTTLSGISLFGENDSQSFEVIFPPNDGNLNNSVSIQLIEEVDAEFSVKYLEYFTKISGISDSVELKISNDLLCVEYGLGEEGYLRYYLAARIEEDEDMD